MTSENSVFSREFLEILNRHGYRKLHEIQIKAVGSILSNNHTIIVAPTGWGKTEAALFPIFYTLYLLEKKRKFDKGIKAVYITPLRSLNRDIFFRMKKLAHDLGLSIAVRHGDTPRKARRLMVEEPPDVLITTPETLQFILVGKRMRHHLRSTRWVIVDELHEFMSSKRGTQILLSLERLRNLAERRIIKIALSATVVDENFAKKFLVNDEIARIVKEDRRRMMNIKVVLPESILSDSTWEETLNETLDVLRRYLEQRRSVLVFTNTRKMSEMIASELRSKFGIDVKVHHSSLSREERREVEREFKEEKVRTVICTSSLELGIDIGHVETVIQYGSPRQAVKLVQRIGRSMHRYEKTCNGVIIPLSIDDLFESIVLARRAIKGDYEKPSIYSKSLDVLSHQIVGMAISKGRITLEEILEKISRAFPYREMKRDELDDLVKFLDKIGLIRIRGTFIVPSRRAYKYYFEQASTIPDTIRFRVIDIASGKAIGELDESFVYSYLNKETVFLLAGTAWEVINIDEKDHIVHVAPAQDTLCIIPEWLGELIPVSYNVAREVGSLKRLLFNMLKNGNHEKAVKLLEKYQLSRDDAEKVLKYFTEYIKHHEVIPCDKLILVEVMDKAIILTCHFGSKVNNTFSLLLSKFIMDYYRINVQVKVDPYRILIAAAKKNVLTPEVIDGFFRYIQNVDLRQILINAIRSSNLYRWKFYHVAKRFGVIEDKVSNVDKLIRIFSNTQLEKEVLNELLVSKFSLEDTAKVINEILSGKISYIIIRTNLEKLNPFSKGIIHNFGGNLYLKARIPTSLIAGIVRKRLMNERIRLICPLCLKWVKDAKIAELPDTIICPICGSRAVVVTKYNDERVIKIVKRGKYGKLFIKDDIKDYEKYMKIAKLILIYGKRAALTLAGRGIGPVTAQRILSQARNEEELIAKIIEAERRYLETRRFWIEQ